MYALQLQEVASTEAEFLYVIGTYYSQSPLLTDFTPPTPLEQKWFESGCDVNIVYGNFKSENSQDYAQILNEIVQS